MPTEVKGQALGDHAVRVAPSRDANAEPKEAGRPTKYAAEIAGRICAELAEGRSLRDICRADGMPTPSTVRAWALKDPEGFCGLYTTARNLGLDAIADEIFEIADDGTNDWMERLAYNGGVPGWEVNGENVQRSKLRIETRKWYLSKLAPKKYGDRIEVESKVTVMSAEEQRKFDALKELPPEDLEMAISVAKKYSGLIGERVQ
jgi:hypothetical protein